ncbi:hypothetical protein LCGC14_1365370 [marine sediment metagenome]|uniref:Uncharacterized protein n=1 Tax=marine sediment metagenome TaxID=412755 RepID=A0A0F9N919_9ZZZZ
MENKEPLDLNKVRADLCKAPQDVIKTHVSPSPVSDANTGNLYYTVFAYRKGDSKFLGKIKISVKDIVSELKPTETKGVIWKSQ